MKRKAYWKGMAGMLALALTVTSVSWNFGLSAKAANETSENTSYHWEVYDGKSYWYEEGKKQGTENDPKGVTGDGTMRGREICDPAILDAKGNGTWFWLDAIYDGAKAVSKEVWMPYIYQDEKSWDDEKIANVAKESGDMAAQVEKAIRANKEGVTDSAVIGKWVRYDAEGRMVKGWYTVEGADAEIYPGQVGNTYYYDFQTGLMAKGKVTIDGKDYVFDETTGTLVEGKAPVDAGTADDGKAEGAKNEIKVLEKAIYHGCDGSVYVTNGYEYDSTGNVTKEINYNPDGSIAYWEEYEYDSSGNNTRMLFVISWEVYEYDSKGNNTKEKVLYPNHELNDYWTEYEYDSAGNMTKSAMYNGNERDPDEGPWLVSEYEYDSTGKLTAEYSACFGLFDRYKQDEYEYDSAGNMTKKIIYSMYGVHSIFEYEYDSAGNATKLSVYDFIELDGNLKEWYAFEYNSAGNRTKDTKYDANGLFIFCYGYEYDGRGSLTKEIEYDAEGNILGWYGWEYDDAGNVTKDATYLSDGSIWSWTDFEYKTITVDEQDIRTRRCRPKNPELF